MRRLRTILALLLASSSVLMASPDVYRALDVEPAQVISGTVIRSSVMPGGDRQVVCIVTYLTGVRDAARAANVRLGVFIDRDGRYDAAYVRDFGEEFGGFVGNGDLQLLDLDRDGTNELILSWDDFSDSLVEQRRGEVLYHDGQRFVSAWSGSLEYDATKAARSVPAGRRDRFEREVDIAATMRSRGRTLWFQKKVIAVAGERLPEPQLVQESFPLRDPEP